MSAGTELTREERAQEERAARQRLAELGPHLPIGDLDRATFLPSNSNDVWRLDDLVLRVCWRRDRRRSRREVLIGRALPASLLHPSVESSGKHDGLAWQLQRYVPGEALGALWLDLPPSQLRPIVAQLAEMLKTLHAWSPPDDVALALAEREGPQTEFGVNLVALPLANAMELLAPVASLQWVDPALIRAVEARLGVLSEFDPWGSDEPRVVVHGDAQPTNLIVDEGRIVALLDYEWCRRAPRDTELAIWVHILRVTRLVSPDREIPPVLSWLREDYPELFAAPDLAGRLWLYALTFVLQGVLMWQPDCAESELTPFHHLHTLRELALAPPAVTASFF